MLLQNKKVYLSFSVAIIFVMVFLIFGGLIPQPVFAADTNAGTNNDYGLKKTAETAGIPTKDKGAADLATFIGQLIGAVLAFVGVAFLILMIYGGIMWMTARGNEQLVTKAKEIIINAIIGIIIIALSYAVTSLIVSQLGAGGDTSLGVTDNGGKLIDSN